MSEASERAARMLQKRLNQRHCELWPECGCHETLAKWANDLSDEEKIWPMDLFEWAETSIFITLACVARYCPDPATMPRSNYRRVSGTARNRWVFMWSLS